MNYKEIVIRLKAYSGNMPYLLTLKEIVEKGDELTFTQITLAKKFLLTHAIKTDDKSIVEDKVQQFDINWGKYSARNPFLFQRTGINWLLNKEKAMLADDMGLGKSLQSIIAAKELGVSKILIVCPASLKLNWVKEIMPFDNQISVISKDWKPGKFTIINYDILKKYQEQIIKHKFELVIADESHYLKNSSIRTKTFMKIANKVKRVWLLTGTPIANKPIDFYNLLKICKHELGTNKQNFGALYCGGQLTPWGYDYNGASNLKELHYKTQNVILRRRKEDVLELPPKIRTPIYLEFTPKQQKQYERAVADYYQMKYDASIDPFSSDYGKDISERGESFVEISVLRKFTALEKINDGSTLELIKNTIEEGKKVVVFTNYLDVIDTLASQIRDNCVTLDGRLDIVERQRRVELFQSSSGPAVIICNIAIASVGLTLTSATVAIMNDLPWSPATVKQAEDRIYRIGQKELVNIIYPVYDYTIDSIIFDVIKLKTKNIDEAIEGKELTQFNGDITNEVIKLLKKQQK
jgi:SWI/SNF-related matrix-associated actin-dependent regulator of chromatin subfamily A-like protein 1